MGTKLKCIDDTLSDGRLIQDKTYEAIKIYTDTFNNCYATIADESGEIGNWLFQRFKLETPVDPPAADVVNSPSHYTKGIQTYDYIKSWDMDFTTGNVIKYTTRAPYKGKRLEDLKKARWYLEKLIEEAEKDGNSQ